MKNLLNVYALFLLTASHSLFADTPVDIDERKAAGAAVAETKPVSIESYDSEGSVCLLYTSDAADE